ncbi:hypothetical protein OT109_04750 [Phycisphaeraceae bacterium D3-23]
MPEPMQKSCAWSLPLSFAVGSYAVSLTACVLACSVWWSLFSIPPGTTVRPMGQAAASLGIGALGTLVALGLAMGCLVYGRERGVMVFLGVMVTVLALMPVPIARLFYEWVLQTQGLIPAA